MPLYRHRRWTFLVKLLLVICLLVPAAGARSARAVGSPSSTEILWDSWGVPHIFAPDDAGIFRAFGWAQMANHANLLLRLYGEARGRAAEYWGQSYLASDQTVWLLDLPRQARVWYQHQSAAFKTYLTAFAAGINAYAAAHPGAIAAEVRPVLPVSAEDVLAHALRLLYATTSIDPGTSCRDAASFSDDASLGAQHGSNGWAIAPAHTTGNAAMLLANPHLSWTPGLSTWMEAQLTGPGIDAYGGALVGVPVLQIAFNDDLGWTHTSNTIGTCTLYSLTVAGNGYRFGGKVLPFRTRSQAITIRGAGTQLLRFREAIQGPVVTVQGKTVAIRAAGITVFPDYGAFEEWWDMARAHDLATFQRVLARLQIPDQMVIYADRAGHIMSLFNGQVPVHAHGDFAYWANPVPGDTPSTLWTAIYPYSALPKVIDPPSGWVQNSNSAPWLTTYPPQLNPSAYPPAMAPLSLNSREQRAIQLLRAQPRISFEQLIRDKFSSQSGLADRLLPDLLAAARRFGTPLAKRAAAVLARWDHRFDAGSRGAVLFLSWLLAIFIQDGASFFAIPQRADRPLDTPAGLANPRQAVQVLGRVAGQLERTGVPISVVVGAGLAPGARTKGLPLNVAWGQVYRLRRGGIDLPASGTLGDPAGVFRVLAYKQDPDGRFEANFGDGLIFAVRFSRPLQAGALLTYGNASQPNSPHYGDQLRLYAASHLRPVWRSRTEIARHPALSERV